MRPRLAVSVQGLDRLVAFAGGRRGALALFGAALAVYGLESVAMPLAAGRDLGTYVRYYAQMWHEGAVLPMSMLYRTIVAPLAIGVPLDLGGGALAQALWAVLFAVSVVSWSAAALAFGRRAALATAVLLLVFPGYGILFHRLASDALFATGFALWSLLLVRSAARPSLARFAALGLGVALLALIRPGNQVLLASSLLPLVLPLSWRRRFAFTATLLLSAAALLGGYTVYNGLRYRDYTVARGGNAFFPFYRAFTTDHIVSPANGPASRDLARAVQRRLLPQEPYRSYGITLHTFFAHGSLRMWEDLVNLSDEVWGWQSNYGKLRAVGIEAVRAQPLAYAEGVSRSVWQELWQPLFYAVDWGRPQVAASPAAVVPRRVAYALPTPSEGDLIPAARQGFFSTTPDGSIREVWTSPTAHTIVFAEPAQQLRFAQLNARETSLETTVPPYAGNPTLIRFLDHLSIVFPRPIVWLLAGLLGLLWRRPRGSAVALAVASAGLIVIVFQALGIYAITEFALPVVPAFVLLAAAGLLGERTVRRQS